MRRYILLLIISISSLAACQKELNYTNSGSNIITGTDTIYLDTVYLSGISAGVFDTFKLFSYHYDQSNRLTLAKWIPFKISHSMNDSGSMEFYYTGADTLPYKSKSLRTFDLNQSFDTSTRFYFYDNSGRLIKDSTIGSGNSFNMIFTAATVTTSYSYAPGKVSSYTTGETISSQFPGIINHFERKDTSFVNATGDIVKSAFYSLDPGAVAFRKISETIITYDNNPIAYRNLNIFNSLSPVFSGGDTELFPPFDGQRFTTNPLIITTIYYDNLGNTVNTTVTNNTYLYLSNGMPQSSLHDNPYGSGRPPIQYSYYYRAF